MGSNKEFTLPKIPAQNDVKKIELLFDINQKDVRLILTRKNDTIISEYSGIKKIMLGYSIHSFSFSAVMRAEIEHLKKYGMTFEDKITKITIVSKDPKRLALVTTTYSKDALDELLAHFDNAFQKERDLFYPTPYERKLTPAKEKEHSANESLEKLINNLLDSNGMLSKATDVIAEPADLHDLINEILDREYFLWHPSEINNLVEELASHLENGGVIQKNVLDDQIKAIEENKKNKFEREELDPLEDSAPFNRFIKKMFHVLFGQTNK